MPDPLQERAAQVFADDLAADRVPSVRTMFAAEGVDAMLGKVADSQAVL